MTKLFLIWLFILASIQSSQAFVSYTGKFIKNFQNNHYTESLSALHLDDDSFVFLDYGHLPSPIVKTINRVKEQKLQIMGEYNGDLLVANQVIVIANESEGSQSVITGKIQINNIDQSSEFVIVTDNSTYSLATKDRFIRKTLFLYLNKVVRMGGQSNSSRSNYSYRRSYDYDDDYDYDYDDDYEDDYADSEIDYAFNLNSIQLPALYGSAKGKITRTWESGGYAYLVETKQGEKVRLKLTSDLENKYNQTYNNKAVEVSGPIFQQGNTSIIFAESMQLLKQISIP